MVVKLYYHLISPPCRAVLLTIEALKLDVERVIINIGAGDHRTPEFLTLNPQHTIPVLDDNGFVLSESRAIITHLVCAYGNEKNLYLYPNDPKTRSRINQRLFFDIGTLYKRFWDFYVFPQMFGASVGEQKLKDIKEAVRWLDGYLATDKYVAGNHLTVADLSILATVSSMECIDFDFEEYKNVLRWWEVLKMEVEGYDEIITNGLPEFNWFVKSFIKAAKSRKL